MQTSMLESDGMPMRWIILLLILVLLSNSIFAQQQVISTYDPNEVFGVPVHLINSTGDVIGASCNIQILTENYSVIVNAPMREMGAGFYNYTYAAGVGNYLCRVNCTQGELYTSGTCDFNVRADPNGPYYFYIVIFIFFVFLMWLGFYLERAMPLTIAGFLLGVVGINILMNGFPGVTDHFLQESTGIILIGLAMFLMVAPNVDELGKMF